METLIGNILLSQFSRDYAVQQSSAFVNVRVILFTAQQKSQSIEGECVLYIYING